MYEKCLNCDKIGTSCDGPNFMAMGTTELIEWCNARRKQIPGMTYDKIAEQTCLSKGTVSGFFGGNHTDYRIETIRPILKVLVGGKWDDNPCATPVDSERTVYEDKIHQLEKSVVWHEDKIQDQKAVIQDLKEKNAALETLVANTNERMTKDKDFLRKQLEDRYQFLKRKDRVIIILSVLLALCLLVIIAALVIDRTNSGVGFFWLEGLFKPQGVTDGMNLIGKGIT